MTKAAELRAALRDAGKAGLSNSECARIAGGPGQFSNFTRRGEVTAIQTPDGTNYILNADYIPARQKRTADALPIKRRHKKKHAAKQSSKSGKKTIRTIADKVAARTDAPPLKPLALRQLITACRLLRQTVTNQVEGLEDNPMLTGALQNAEAAESLAEAA